MIPFDPENPFPLLTSKSYSPDEASEHSVQVDRWLGLNESVEENVGRDPNYAMKCDETGFIQKIYWIGLPVQILQTPYVSVRTMIEKLKPRPGETVVGLGCAYGRMAHVLGRYYPGVNYVGYEFIPERVHEGRRILEPFRYPGVHLEVADLSAPNFQPAPARYYFMFDYGSHSAIEKTLADLREIAQESPITLVGRGGNCEKLIKSGHPWLTEVSRLDDCTYYESR